MCFDVHVICYNKKGVRLWVVPGVIMVVPFWVKKNFGASLVEIEKVDVPYFHRANHKFI